MIPRENQKIDGLQKAMRQWIAFISIVAITMGSSVASDYPWVFDIARSYVDTNRGWPESTYSLQITLDEPNIIVVRISNLGEPNAPNKSQNTGEFSISIDPETRRVIEELSPQ